MFFRHQVSSKSLLSSVAFCLPLMFTSFDPSLFMPQTSQRQQEELLLLAGLAMSCRGRGSGRRRRRRRRRPRRLLHLLSLCSFLATALNGRNAALACHIVSTERNYDCAAVEGGGQQEQPTGPTNNTWIAALFANARPMRAFHQTGERLARKGEEADKVGTDR